MSENHKTALITWTTGDRSAPPVLLLHDRYRDHDELDPLGSLLAPSRRVVTTRSARTQQENTTIKGYYWFLGPYERPELSTFGDGLHHLERLLLTLSEPGRQVALVGRGEGGTMALMLALVWRELVAAVASIDGPLPANIDELPLSLGPATGLPVLLAESTRALDDSAQALAARGARLERQTLGAGLDPVATWITRQPAAQLAASSTR